MRLRLPTELENYSQRLEDLRGQIQNLITAVTPEQLNQRPLQTELEQTNSLAVLVAHVCGAEHFWISEVLGGKPPTRNRPAEFTATVDSHSELFHLLHQTSEETKAVLSTLSPNELETSRLVEGKEVPVRWALLHVVDHTALHLGHLQMTYQLITGSTVQAPLWTQRIP